MNLHSSLNAFSLVELFVCGLIAPARIIAMKAARIGFVFFGIMSLKSGIVGWLIASYIVLAMKNEDPVFCN